MTETSISNEVLREPYLDSHGQQLPTGVHPQHDKRGSQVLLLSPDHIGWNPIQQNEVNFKQGTILEKGMHPFLEFKGHTPASCR